MVYKKHEPLFIPQNQPASLHITTSPFGVVPFGAGPALSVSAHNNLGLDFTIESFLILSGTDGYDMSVFLTYSPL